LHDVSFSIGPQEIVGLIGESGCGKSLTAATILRLLSPSFQVSGKIYFEGNDLLKLTSKQLLRLRGSRLSLIMQDPSSALNPLMTLGKQLIEGLCIHKKLSKQEAHAQGLSWLERVGIDHPSQRMSQYPHEISGGMKQRLLIAMALICQPSLVIADEPTTALDVTIQAQILDLLLLLQKEEKMSLLLITHDVGVVAKCCQKVVVMHKGEIIETGEVEQVFTDPKHAFTRGLIHARRILESLTRSHK
jgi:ABC-type dipeptide/oligopeptide/nickel transport system ATPase component